jgi:uncharacterized protein YukE
MSDGMELNSDPDKIERAAKDMMGYAEFLEGECRNMESALQNLSSKWRDRQFEEFKTHFLGMSLELKGMIAKIRETKPVLDKNVSDLRDFQAHNNYK